jgi:hypothetical protein
MAAKHLPPGHLPPGHLPPGHLPGGGGDTADGNINAIAPTYRTADWKTMCDKFNEGAVQQPDYVFANGRRFYQRGNS